MYLSVVIPAYNEEKRIGKTLQRVHQYLSNQPFDWEILVALDGSIDNTWGLVSAFAEDKPAVRYINRTENRGKGYTVREGMMAAKGEIRLFTDADNSTDIAHFDLMKPLFEQGHEVVIGSRDSKDAPGAIQAAPQPFYKRLLGNLANLFIQAMAVPGIWDTQCGFKAFTATATERVFPLARLDHWGLDFEALAIARRCGYPIGIVPANWINDSGTHVRLVDYPRTLLEAIRIRLNLLTGAYRCVGSA